MTLTILNRQVQISHSSKMKIGAQTLLSKNII